MEMFGNYLNAILLTFLLLSITTLAAQFFCYLQYKRFRWPEVGRSAELGVVVY